VYNRTDLDAFVITPGGSHRSKKTGAGDESIVPGGSGVSVFVVTPGGSHEWSGVQFAPSRKLPHDPTSRSRKLAGHRSGSHSAKKPAAGQVFSSLCAH